MAAKFGELMIEKRSIDYVPIAERHGKVWHLWPVWFSGDAHLATVATGVVGVALGGHLLWMAIAVLLGCAFGTFFMAFHSTQGPQLGLPQMIQSRPQFGYVGALLVWVVALIAYIGFNAFNQILAAQTVLSLYGGDPTLIMVVFSLLSVSLAVIGYDLIHLAQRWIAYVLIAALLVFTVAVLAKAAPAGAGNRVAATFVPCRSWRNSSRRPPIRSPGPSMCPIIRATCRATWEWARRSGGPTWAPSSAERG